MLTIKLNTSTSFRALSHQFQIQTEFFSEIRQVPTHTTLINWVHKVGYYQLTKEKTKADDWIIILDHSIQLGQDKMQVILGIRERDIDFTRPLRYQDLVPLGMWIKNKWNATIVADTIKQLQESIGTIIYAVCDNGGELKKGLRLCNMKQVYDITHMIAGVFEKNYKTDGQYQQLTKRMSEMRVKLSQTEVAHIIPPKQRTKSSYQNIRTLVNWASNSLNSVISNESTETTLYDQLSWLKEYQQFINELSEINTVICSIEKQLKHQGLSEQTLKYSQEQLNSLCSQKGKIFKEKIIDALSSTIALLPNHSKILCTSDILESAFGKYKNFVSENPMAGITNLVLTIAAFTCSLATEELRDSLEKIRTVDIKNWTEKNIGISLFRKRKLLFTAT